MSEKTGFKTSGARALRIAYLLQQFPVKTETFVVSDIVALMAMGHQVTVYTLKWPRRNEAALLTLCGVPADLAVDRPSWRGLLGWPRTMWKRRKATAGLARRLLPHLTKEPVVTLQALACLPRIVEIADRIMASGDDVVHAFWSRHVGLVLPALEIERAPAIRTAFAGAYDLVADDVLVDLTTRSAQALFSHAEANAPYLLRKARDGVPTAIVLRGIPLPLNDESVARDPLRWVTASALVPDKNVEAVVRAFARFRDKNRALKLDIFGDGPDRERLEKLADALGCHEGVTFGGHISRDALRKQMQAASIFLLLSTKRSERLPNVVKEALWAGCAVVASNSEGIEEMIPDERVGFVVDPSDPKAVDAAIAAALSAPEQDAAKRRREARDLVADKFSAEGSMRKYVQVWRSLLPRRDAFDRQV